MSGRSDVTRLLAALGHGESHAFGQLFPLVYSELKEIARRQLRRGAEAETLNTTAVVHEAYLKLVGSGGASINDSNHFFALAARAMRQILVDHARSHISQKRGGGVRPMVLDDRDVQVDVNAEAILDLDAALDRLAALDERLGRVVELRFYAGLSIDETAELLGVTDRTVKRDWRKARALLYQDLFGDFA
jgi:RNA polymerase sigma factor (TIGR02999 family)